MTPHYRTVVIGSDALAQCLRCGALIYDGRWAGFGEPGDEVRVHAEYHAKVDGLTSRLDRVVPEDSL